jgi:hypothetical protein
MKSPCLLGCCATWLAVTAWAGTAKFAQTPTVVREGDQFAIRFAATTATDVEIRIVTDDGRTMRHLAAGRLGPTPPAPLQTHSLAQSVRWDGLDDSGRPIPPDVRLKAIVSLGLTPKLDRVIGNNPADLGGIRAMATGPDGRLYLFHAFAQQHSGDSSIACAVFDRSGRYIRTILPFPADLPDKRLTGIRRLDLGKGAKGPYLYQPETRSYLPGLGDLPNQRAIVSADGRLGFIGIQEGPRVFAQPGVARFTVVQTDGSVPAGGALKALIHPLTDTANALALSPDGKTIYATGIRAGLHPNGPTHDFVCEHCDHAGYSSWEHTVPVPFVFTFTWDDPQARVLIGGPKLNYLRPEGAAVAETNAVQVAPDQRLIEPVSLATDAAGNLYVADVAQDAILVIAPAVNGQCRFVRRIAVVKPQRVEVSRKTGAIYVLAGDREVELIKLAGLTDPAIVARLTVTKNARGIMPTRRPIIALDESSNPPLIWIGQPFWRVEDHGNAFGSPLDLRSPERVGKPAMAAVMEMSLDRIHGWLYVNNGQRMNTATGTWESFTTAGGRMWPTSNPGSASGNAGRDGNYYVDAGARGPWLYRYGPDLNPLPFPSGTPVDVEGRIHGPARNRGVGQTADYHGNVYALFKRGDAGRADIFHKASSLFRFDPQGRPLHAPLIDCAIPNIYSPRVDRAGNIYLAVGLRPGKGLLVPGLAGQVPNSLVDPDAVNQVNGYPLVYGSVVKFGPKGGRIGVDVGGAECNLGPGVAVQVKGAEWIVPGVSMAGSMATPKRAPGSIITCVCEYPNIDVDEFARVFFPDAARCRVGVLDSAGNELCHFGSYGNADSAGPGSLIPTPAIPMWWPQAIAVDDTTAYVGDRLNRRILAVKLEYAARAECPIPQ